MQVKQETSICTYIFAATYHTKLLMTHVVKQHYKNITYTFTHKIDTYTDWRLQELFQRGTKPCGLTKMTCIPAI